MPVSYVSAKSAEVLIFWTLQKWESFVRNVLTFYMVMKIVITFLKTAGVQNVIGMERLHAI